MVLTRNDAVAGCEVNRRACFIRAAVMLIAALSPSAVPARDAGASNVIRFDISRQRADQALIQFAEQADVTFIFPAAEARKVTANAVRGEFTPEEAIERLLQGTGLEPGYNASGAWTVKADDNSNRGDAMNKRGLLAGVIAALTGAGHAHAQESAGTQPTQALTLEEVVVTAQRREERLQDVPISISVLGGSALDRSPTGVIDALAFVPSVAMSGGYVFSGNNLFGVRGVTASNGFSNGASPIAYYVDAVPFGAVRNAQVPDVNPYDLERVEVLRGPQGTLYGAGGEGGVVRVLTRDADLNEFEVKTRASLSAVDQGGENYRADAAINVPIVAEKLAARLVVGYEDASGWIDGPVAQDINDNKTSSARLKISAQPIEALSIGLSAWMSRLDSGAPAVSDANNFFPGTLDQQGSTDFDLLGMKIGYDFAAFSITSATGYVEYENRTGADFTYLGFGNTDLLLTTLTSRVLSEEVTLSSKGDGAWRWTAGAFYRDAEDLLVQELSFYPAPLNVTDRSESFAVFGELTRAFMDGRLELTGGLRYFEDKVTMIENVRHCGSLCPGEAPIRVEDTYNPVSPRVVLTWHATENSTLYASYSEGFRSGFSNLPAVYVSRPDFPTVHEEVLTNYEVGAKGSLLEGRIEYETAVYYIQWDDVQQLVPIQYNGIDFSALINGESASGPGAEAGVTFRPVRGLDVALNFGWNDLTMDGAVLTPNGTPFFEEGDRLSLSSEYTAGTSVGCDFPLGSSGFDGAVSLSVNYASKSVVRDAAGDFVQVLVGEDVVNSRANVAITSPNRWTVSLFADNLTNEHRLLRKDLPGRDTYQRPRTVGLQFEFRL